MKIRVGSWSPLFVHENFSHSRPGTQNLASTYAIQTLSFYLFFSAVVTPKIDKEHELIPPIFQLGGCSSAVFSPNGKKVTEDLDESYDGSLFHEIDLGEIVANKHLLDIVGHYSRSDMLSLNVHKSNEDLAHHG